MRAPSDAHARLVAACAAPGCPVCRCVADASRRYLAALVHEQVTDVQTRRRLRRAGGFCATHGAMLQAVPDAAFGAAILHEDLLRLVVERFERVAQAPAGAAAGPRRWLARLVGGARDPVTAHPLSDAGACPACADAAGAEMRAVDAVLALASDAGLRSAYETSDGVCVPHMAVAMERGRHRPETALLLQTTLAKWRALREALARFIARHDHRSREPVAAEEARALQRALATLRGAPGVAGSDQTAPEASA